MNRHDPSGLKDRVVPVEQDRLPDSNPKTRFGTLKPPLHYIPPIAIIQLGLAMENGGIKYDPFNWREQKISASVYYDAAMRHLMSWWDGEDVDGNNQLDSNGEPLGSGLPHLAHVMACCAIILDAANTGRLIDDRHHFSIANQLPDVAAAIRAITEIRTRKAQEEKGKPDDDRT